MSYRGEGVNEYGTEVGLFTCDLCYGDFSVCPAPPEDKRDNWNECLDENCESYDPGRDGELYLGLRMIEVG